MCFIIDLSHSETPFFSVLITAPDRNKKRIFLKNLGEILEVDVE